VLGFPFGYRDQAVLDRQGAAGASFSQADRLIPGRLAARFRGGGDRLFQGDWKLLSRHSAMVAPDSYRLCAFAGGVAGGHATQTFGSSAT
jgi:hypothetical protein